jgi:GH24 family phage-related lysozyme (muramidase)
MESQVVEIESEKYGIFEVEAPTNWSSEDIKTHVEGLDLDLMLGIEQDETGIGETQVEKIKEWENSVGAGKRDDKWFPHASLEGGTDTVAYGHKLTAEEAESGIIKLGDREVNWRQGLSEEDAMALLNKDAGWAKKVALSSLRKANMADDDNKVQALTSLIYNVGSGAWGKSKAKKYLEAGNVEDFMHEAFDKEIGFVKINGDISRGLQRRRAAEASLFAQGNIEQGDSVMSQVLDAINPISTAQAATLSPETNMEPTENQGTLGSVTVPKKPRFVPKDYVQNSKEPVLPHNPFEGGLLGEVDVPEKGKPPLNYDLPKMIWWGLLSNAGFDVEITNKDLDPRTLAAQAEAMGGKTSLTSYTQYGKDVADEQTKVYDTDASKFGQVLTGLTNLLKAPDKLLEYMQDDRKTAAFVLGRLNIDGEGNTKDERWNFNKIKKGGLSGAASPFTAGRAFLEPFMPNEDDEGPVMNVNIYGKFQEQAEESEKSKLAQRDRKERRSQTRK